MKHKTIVALAVGLSLVAAQANAQSWNFDGSAVDIPASVDGVKIAGATLGCVAGKYSLVLETVTIGDGKSDTPVAILVDGSVFATTAAPSGAIAVPPAALPALKTGKRMTVSFPAAGTNIEAVFALKGSSKALDALASNCPEGTTPEAPAPDAAPEAADSGVTLDFATSAVAEQALQVSFTGPAGKDDWIGFALVGSAPSEWVAGAYFYVSKGSPQSITVPVAFGTYEIRYVTGDGKVLLSKTVDVTASRETFVSGPEAAVGGSPLRIDFAGPLGASAFVGIAKAGDAPAAALGKNGVFSTPVSMRAPLDPGDYEYRYVDDSGKILAKQGLMVSAAPKVTLASMEATPGSPLNVELADAPRWSGDYIYIARAGSPDADYGGGYVGVPSTGPATINAPAEAGEWEIRYIVPSGGSYVALGRASLLIK